MGETPVSRYVNNNSATISEQVLPAINVNSQQIVTKTVNLDKLGLWNFSETVSEREQSADYLNDISITNQPDSSSYIVDELLVDVKKYPNTKGVAVGNLRKGESVKGERKTIEQKTQKWWLQLAGPYSHMNWVELSKLKPDTTTQGSGYVELTISPKGENFTTLCEGHDDILANGNYAVIDTGDYKLTTYGGLTIAEEVNGIWVPINGFTQSEVNNWSNGISPTVWRTNYDTYRNRSATAINKFASDNGLKFTQYQFDALMDFGWTNGNVINSKESNGTYTYDFVNIMLESGFLTNPTTSQIDKFESAFGNLVSMGGIRTSGFWARRMSQLSVFWGETDSNGDYMRKEYGNTQQTKIAADAWLTSRGLNPTAR